MLTLCGLSLLANNPAWDIPLSIIMATATYLTAPYVVTTWLARRLTLRSLLFWLSSTAVTFDIYQIARTGSWHPEGILGNLAASTVLYMCAGLVWTLDIRRYWVPVGGRSPSRRSPSRPGSRGESGRPAHHEGRGRRRSTRKRTE
jgi:hypothetical protein